jgi:hypothetical protein
MHCFGLKIETRNVPTDMLLLTKFSGTYKLFFFIRTDWKSFGYNYIYTATYLGDYRRGLDWILVLLSTNGS